MFIVNREGVQLFSRGCSFVFSIERDSLVIFHNFMLNQ